MIVRFKTVSIIIITYHIITYQAINEEWQPEKERDNMKYRTPENRKATKTGWGRKCCEGAREGWQFQGVTYERAGPTTSSLRIHWGFSKWFLRLCPRVMLQTMNVCVVMEEQKSTAFNLIFSFSLSSRSLVILFFSRSPNTIHNTCYI